MNKTELVKRHLENGKPITTWEAYKLYNETRLSGVIYNLKKRHGMDIHSTEHKGDFAVYTLAKEAS